MPGFAWRDPPVERYPLGLGAHTLLHLGDRWWFIVRGGIVKEVGAALVFTFRYGVSNDSNSGGTFSANSAGAIVAVHFNF